MHSIVHCRSCQSPDLRSLVSFGDMPVADLLIDPKEAQHPPALFPLHLVFCPQCSLVQIRETLPPEFLFNSDYPYFSSFSDDLLAHARDNAMELLRAEGLTEKHQVIEIASNDGYMLRHFADAGIPVLGIDPAAGPVSAARNIGIPTEQEFFTYELAQHWKANGRTADVLIANNVLAHVADSLGFVKGLAAILKPTGVASIEFPYVRDLIDHCEFDTIYHQHLCYFSVTSAQYLLAQAGLVIHDVRRLPIHGGTLRLYVSHDRPVSEAVVQLLEQEQALGIASVDYYLDFANRVNSLRDELRQLILELVESNHRIACYGAAAKGTTLLGCLGLPRNVMEYVVDRNVHKHGRMMPGSLLPIGRVERLAEDQPDYVLLLAWNFKDEIIRQQCEYRNAGGKFIVPIPQIQVI
ncbi:MAG: class I SAM-dependent methyltransferase [Planctomycetales bacterium]|nr:class I SAM-dependent methyltransferase [Planctomycetales bacterium]